MNRIFLANLPLLKLFFYQLDRLVSILLPDVHSYFKDEMIHASYYSAPWFITLFSNALQQQHEERIHENLLRLWDSFLVHGFKTLFRAGIAML